MNTNNLREQRKEFTRQRHIFTRSDRWKQFRLDLIAKRGSFCEACGRPVTKALQCHHNWKYTTIEEYTDLTDESRFLLVCKQCHSLIERLSDSRKETLAAFFAACYGKQVISAIELSNIKEKENEFFVRSR